MTRFLARWATFGWILAAAAVLAGCATGPGGRPGRPGAQAGLPEAPSGTPLRFRLIGETRLPAGVNFQGTVVGGLSGIDYDPEGAIWYLVSDDRSEHGPARFYTARMAFHANGFDKVELLSAVTIRRPDGTPYAKAPALDVPAPESLRFDPLTKSLLWTSEGERRRGRIVQPAVRKMALDGKYLDQLALPPMFTITSDRQGPRNLLSFEGMTLSPSHKAIWVSMEEAMFQDGPVSSLRQGGLTRFTQFDRTARRAVAQYVYMLEPIPYPPNPVNDYADNGVAEILALSETSFLVLERSYAEGRGNSIRLYEASTEDASNVLDVQSLKSGSFRPMKKRLVLDFAALRLKRVENLQGMSWGPKLANGHRTLVFVADDNFSAAQATQFVALEVIE